MRNIRRVVAAAGLAGVMGSALFLPARADERGPERQAAEAVPAIAGYYADLVTSIAPSPPSWLTPDYPGQVAEAVPAIAGYYADLVTSIAPSPPSWLTPDYPGQVAEAVPAIAGYYADLVTSIAPSPPSWLTPDYPGQVAEAVPAIAGYYAGAAAEHYGGGPFTGSVTWDGPIPLAVEECRVDRAAVRGTVAITADVAFTAGTTTFTGPLAITGTTCGGQRNWLAAGWSASGTDPLGNTFRCTRLEGLAMWTTHWYANVFGRDCTVNNVALPRVQLLLAGEHVSAEPTTGSMTGALSVNTY